MKLLPAKFVVLLSVALIGFAGSAFAQGPEKETELGKEMKIIGKNMKQLKGQIADATKQASTIELLEAAKKAAEDGKKLSPAQAANVPEADRPKFVTEYQAQMDKLIEQFGKIEDAVKAGKYDDATKLFGDLNQIKRDGHTKFQPPEK